MWYLKTVETELSMAQEVANNEGHIKILVRFKQYRWCEVICAMNQPTDIILCCCCCWLG